MQSKNPISVLYIIGSGRSGSTILDIVLGNHPDIESVGEIGNRGNVAWISYEAMQEINRKRKKEPRSLLCSCGKRWDVLADSATVCPFWSRVRREWVASSNKDDIETYPVLMETFERYRHWLRLLRERRNPSPQFQSYSKLTHMLFASIRSVNGKSIVVDSSKQPPRALALSIMPGIDLRLVHLVRDPRAVAASRKKGTQQDEKSHPVWKSSLRWVYENLTAEWVCARLGQKKVRRIRYEDLREDAVGELNKIGTLVDLNLSDIARASASGQSMEVGHDIGGNSVRMSKVVKLQPDAGKWRHLLLDSEQRLSWTLTGWLARRYGYKR